ncbi:MAG: TatD family hydrolase [Gemmatimonadaceae bacterium]
MPAFIDSHCHLADPAFDADRDEAVERARAAGATALVCIGESPEMAVRARAVAARHAGYVFHSAGVHPHDAATFDAVRDIAALRDEAAHGAVALGECGLDYHYDHSPRDQQRRAFAAQLALASELRLPVVVHSREAADDTAAMVREAGAAGVVGVMHCFAGPPALAEVAIAAGWYLSFSGIITFKKWADDALLRLPPADRLLVESDAPYLSPVPYRGKRNEPAFVSHTVIRLAEARGLSADRLGDVVTENAVRCFGLRVAV